MKQGKAKDPLFILDAIHGFSQAGFVQLLKEIQEGDEFLNNKLYFFGRKRYRVPYFFFHI